MHKTPIINGIIYKRAKKEGILIDTFRTINRYKSNDSIDTFGAINRCIWSDSIDTSGAIQLILLERLKKRRQRRPPITAHQVRPRVGSYKRSYEKELQKGATKKLFLGSYKKYFRELRKEPSKGSFEKIIFRELQNYYKKNLHIHDNHQILNSNFCLFKELTKIFFYVIIYIEKEMGKNF